MDELLEKLKKADRKKVLIYSFYSFLAVFAFLAGNYLGSLYLPEVKSRVSQFVNRGEEVETSSQEGSVGIKDGSTLEINGEIVNIPGEDASTQERADFGNILSQNAVTAEKVVIGDECKLDPAIFRLNSGESVTFTNEDEKAHDISVFRVVETLEVSQEVEITLDIEPGFYGVVCDSSSGVGFVVLE